MMHVRVVGMVSQITDARKQVVFLTSKTSAKILSTAANA